MLAVGAEQPLTLCDITNQRNLTLKYSHALFEMRQKNKKKTRRIFEIRDFAYADEKKQKKIAENVEERFMPSVRKYKMPELAKWKLGRGENGVIVIVCYRTTLDRLALF